MEHPLLYINIPGLEHYPHVTFMWVWMVIFTALGIVIKKNLSLVPQGLQSLFELLIGGLSDFMDETMGHGGRRFLPLIGTLFIFIICSNLGGLIPGFAAPTANLNTNAAMAITVFLTYNFIGVRKHGFIPYLKTLMGPIPWLAPLMFPIELITHCARPLALSVRLFGNIFGEELVLVILAVLVPFVIPVPMMFISLIAGTIQAAVFTLLSIFYIAGALEEGH